MKTYTSNNKQLGRNDKCHCGSGKKYKKCCMNTEHQNNNQSTTNQMTNTTTMNSDRLKELQDVEVYSTQITSIKRCIEGKDIPNWDYPNQIKNMSSDKLFELLVICDIENNGIEDPSIVRIIHNTPIYIEQLSDDVFKREMYRGVGCQSEKINDFLNNDTIFHPVMMMNRPISLEEKDLKDYVIQSHKTDLETLIEMGKEYKKVG